MNKVIASSLRNDLSRQKSILQEESQKYHIFYESCVVYRQKSISKKAIKRKMKRNIETSVLRWKDTFSLPS